MSAIVDDFLPNVLVSDFDGTMTRHDFYLLAIESLIPAGCPDYWAEFRDGRKTHFEALQHYFASITASEEEVQHVLQQMELDPGLATAVFDLKRAGWDVVITSAGCDWYIHRLLNQAEVSLKVYANPGSFEPGHGLHMSLPTDSAFLSKTLGVNKTQVVQHLLNSGRRVAFAGDGFPDAEPARLVDESLRFARGDLSRVLESDGLRYRPFEIWSDIARGLLKGVD